MLKKARKLVLVTKPGIVCGNLIAAAGGFSLASGGFKNLAMMLPTIVGISLVVASGCVFNNYIDRHLDRKMDRTFHRVLAQGLLSTRTALSFGMLLGIAGFAILLAMTNILCTAVVLTGFLIYVGIYSLYLKRYSIYGTIIGSLAGAAPPLAGYCAVRNHFDTGAALLLAIFILWQIPHSYAIAIFHIDDYRTAAIPVLPVLKGLPVAKIRMLFHIAAFTVASLLPTFFGFTGYGYLTIAFLLGLTWLFIAWSGYRNPENEFWTKRLFVFSILSILLLSVMMAFDASIPEHSSLRNISVARIQPAG